MQKEFENPDQDENLDQDTTNDKRTESEMTAEEEEMNQAQEKENDTEVQELKNKYIRLFAEFDNYKKRTAKENIEIRLTAGRDIITSMLDVLDDMDRAEEQFSKTDDCASVKEGSLLIFNKFRKILESRGLKALETLHTPFDVEKDEAISEMPVDDEKLKGKVIAEVQKGYALNDKIIRFAKVVVGR